jgi:predicted O-linked N-acetylglucosamine transferase (SPINDLY family)
LIDEAIAALHKGLEFRPAHFPAHSNLIFALHSHPDSTPGMILQEQKRWDQRHARPVANSNPPHNNDRSPDRRLRIGYVSADFREHVIGWNLGPILEHHDHKNFEIFCYSSVSAADYVADALRTSADVWRNVGTLDDAALAKVIREDQIDILIDLSLHTLGNRLLVFARKPAPIQISYLGYCGAAGLSAIDYRLSDPYLDNAQTERDYVEKTLYLPSSYWCYRPGDQSAIPSSTPVIAGGHITFGCLCNFAKASLAAQRLWAQILASVKDSRLILHSPPGEHLSRVKQRFASWGIEPDRIEFLPKQAPAQYLQSYGRIDIALDPFPYNGGITTCDALWMGVPVITLAGNLSVGRAGKSILNNVGLADLVGEKPQQYVDHAVKLAGDIPRLAELRGSLREKMLRSPLMDGSRFTRDLETIYRRVWREWCIDCDVAKHG